MKVLVTGANGFVGKRLIEKLLESGHEVFALVRSGKEINSHQGNLKILEGDLLEDKALPKLDGIDKAYYLVHGLKSAESDFEYEESLAAIHFVNWIRPTKAGIIYLGGLAPHVPKLSSHLRSRNLTGKILAASGLPTTEFRASIVLGEGSSSFEIIKALSERFPVRPDFSLLNHLCQPLALSDLLSYLVDALRLTHEGHKIYEIGGPDQKTYGELLDLYAELSGLKRKLIKIPEIDFKVLMKIIDYAIPEYALVGKKLTESLEFPTVVTNDLAKREFPNIKTQEVRVAMDIARANSKTTYAPIWEKDFLKTLLSDKILTNSGLLSPEVLRSLEKFGKIKDILSRK